MVKTHMSKEASHTFDISGEMVMTLQLVYLLYQPWYPYVKPYAPNHTFL